MRSLIRLSFHKEDPIRHAKKRGIYVIDDDPNHSVIERPYEYEIVEFSYIQPLDGSEPFIDLGLTKGGKLRRLRFFGAQDVEITKGFPRSSGLVIRDVSARNLERLGVRVINLENETGCPEFWARVVVELTAEKEGVPTI
jgi:hypothetical protein